MGSGTPVRGICVPKSEFMLPIKKSAYLKNPRKWICVNAKSVKSASKGEYAILVMTSVEVMPEDYDDEAAIEAAEKESAEKSEERASLIINNFLAAV